ncbi:Flp pilus assembly protein TadG [Nakamurella flavida]|nr:TadE family type IV pilus minor pilin [Nakamurella flavida]MDP9779645.1 Flp pilus assembly protein TadG [Nakamurella flavida]
MIHPGDRGGVTVEAAIGLSAVMVVLMCCLSGIAVLTAHLRCQDAAQEAARLAGRGDDAAARAAVTALAPDGATVSFTQDGDLVVVTVRAPAPGGVLPIGPLHASAVAAREDGVAG